MGYHVSRQIREALMTALTGLASTGDRVYPGRFQPLPSDELPALRVWAADEDIDIASMGGATRAVERVAAFVVELLAKSEDADDVIDAMKVEVETALANAGTLGSLVKYVQPRRYERDESGEQDEPVVVTRLRVEVLYFTALGTPDTAL